MVGQVSASTLPKRSRYTLNDIAELVLEAHTCLHRVDEKLDEHREEMLTKLGVVGERVATLEGKSQAIGERVGVDLNKEVQKTAWYLKPWQICSGVCGAAGGFVVLYKIASAVAPAIHHALLAQ